MTMIKPTNSWQESKGSLDDLVTEVIHQLAPLDPGGVKLKDVNARLIRYYVSIKAMSRPLRVGKEVRFQWRHVLECMVIRVLLSEDWPLAKIVDLVPQQDDAGLAALLPIPSLPLDDHRQQVQALIANFRQSSTGQPAAKTQAAMTTVTQERLQLRRDLYALGTPQGRVRTDDLVRLRLAPGCEVLLSAKWWRALDEERIERVADALKQALREESFKRGGPKS
jgi:DNA-binding transcriptional MerR regulator